MEFERKISHYIDDFRLQLPLGTQLFNPVGLEKLRALFFSLGDPHLGNSPPKVLDLDSDALGIKLDQALLSLRLKPSDRLGWLIKSKTLWLPLLLYTLNKTPVFFLLCPCAVHKDNAALLKQIQTKISAITQNTPIFYTSFFENNNFSFDFNVYHTWSLLLLKYYLKKTRQGTYRISLPAHPQDLLNTHDSQLIELGAHKTKQKIHPHYYIQFNKTLTRLFLAQCSRDILDSNLCDPVQKGALLKTYYLKLYTAEVYKLAKTSNIEDGVFLQSLMFRLNSRLIQFNFLQGGSGHTPNALFEPFTARTYYYQNNAQPLALTLQGLTLGIQHIIQQYSLPSIQPQDVLIFPSTRSRLKQKLPLLLKSLKASKSEHCDCYPRDYRLGFIYCHKGGPLYTPFFYLENAQHQNGFYIHAPFAQSRPHDVTTIVTFLSSLFPNIPIYYCHQDRLKNPEYSGWDALWSLSVVLPTAHRDIHHLLNKLRDHTVQKRHRKTPHLIAVYLPYPLMVSCQNKALSTLHTQYYAQNTHCHLASRHWRVPHFKQTPDRSDDFLDTFKEVFIHLLAIAHYSNALRKILPCIHMVIPKDSPKLSQEIQNKCLTDFLFSASKINRSQEPSEFSQFLSELEQTFFNTLYFTLEQHFNLSPSQSPLSSLTKQFKKKLSM